MERPGDDAQRLDRDEFAVFEEVTPAAHLIQRLIAVARDAKNSADKLNQTVNELKRLQDAASVAAKHKRSGHGPILYPPERDLLADIDAALMAVPAWDHPKVVDVCAYLASMKGTGMSHSTLHDNLVRRKLLPEGMTVKRFLIERKHYLDEQAEGGRSPRLLSHIAAAMLVLGTCLSKIDPGNVRRLLLLD
jgi:hypothetical protein